MIDETAIIHPSVNIHEDVSIGPYSVIGQDVSIESGTVIGSHVVIKGPTSIGQNNKIFHFCSIGEEPQDKKFNQDSNSSLVIGSGNTIREYVSINRGTDAGGGKTVIGNENWIMAYVHIAHDCIIGNNSIFANNATLAGHVIIENFVTLGGFTGVHQFCRVGSYSFSAISSVIVKDVLPYILVSGNTAKPSGLNREGLKRNGFDYLIGSNGKLILNDYSSSSLPFVFGDLNVEEFVIVPITDNLNKYVKSFATDLKL